MKKKVLNCIAVIIISCVSIISCNDNPTQIKTLHSPDFQTPVVTGLRITSNNGPTVIGIWRKPFDTEKENANTGYTTYITNPNGGVAGYYHPPTDSYLECPFPNPAGGSITLEYSVATAGLVNCWVVQAILPESKSSEVTRQYGGSSLPIPNGYAVDVLLNKSYEQTGLHQLTWDNHSFPTGYYRIYLQVKDTLFWRDMLLYRQSSDIPADLLQLLPSSFPLFF